MNVTRPEFHEKGWGYELWIVNNDKYCGKILHFYPGKRCSFHYHKIKHEHFYVSYGMFQIRLANTEKEVYTLKTTEKTLYAGNVIEIPTGLIHQMIALVESEIIEISTQHFEDDSYRVVNGD
jgi:mannose-6-phosphate isomerase-like protein (cupin superfamily)